MAEISKYKAHAVGRLFLHNLRKEDDGVTHSNEYIDPERTHLNYAFKEGGVPLYQQRLSEVYHMDRDNLTTLAEVIVTLPKDVRRADEQRFFESVYRFYVNDFREENIINAIVHKDEITPHIHIDFIPAMVINRDELSNAMLERIQNYEQEHNCIVTANLCARDLLNRAYFQKMHPRLLEYVTNDLGYTCEILNGATAGGNKTVLELKNKTLEKEIEMKQNQFNSINESVNFITRQIESMGLNRDYFSSTEIFMHMASVTKERDILKQIIIDNNIPLPSESMNEIILQNNMLKESHFNITYNDIDFNTSNIIVLETYKDIPRVPPMWKFMQSDTFIEDIINGNPKNLEVFDYNNKKYIIFPTDNIEDTFHNMLVLKQMSRKFRGDKVVFPHISNDTVNIGEVILRQCQFETEYHMDKRDDERQRMQVRLRGDE